MRGRLLNLLIALDQLGYVLLTLGYGSPDETMSSAAYRMEQKGKLSGRVFRPLIDFLLRPFEVDHCWKSYVAEKTHVHFPKDMR